MNKKPNGKPWLRLWCSFLYDLDIQRLSEADQRRYLMILILQREGKFQRMTDEEIAHALRISVTEYGTTRERLGNATSLKVGRSIGSWNKYQFDSDLSTARTRRYRQRQKDRQENGTFRERSRNGEANVPKAFPVTPPDADASSYEEARRRTPIVPTKKSSRELLEIVEKWNLLAVKNGYRKTQGKDSTVETISKALKRKSFKTEWRSAMDIVSSNPDPWYAGDNDRGWVANIDWFCRKDTMSKVLNGWRLTSGPSSSERELAKVCGVCKCSPCVCPGRGRDDRKGTDIEPAV